MKPAISYPGISGSSGRSSLRVYLLLIILIVVLIIYYRMPRPCREPLTYRIGTVDTRFGLSASSLQIRPEGRFYLGKTICPRAFPGGA